MILSISDIFLINNGPVANSGIQLPIPLILIMYLELADFWKMMTDSPKKGSIPWNRQEELATSKSPLLAV